MACKENVNIPVTAPINIVAKCVSGCGISVEDITSTDGSVTITQTEVTDPCNPDCESIIFDLSAQGGGSGEASWPNVTDKPFEDIGDGLDVVDGTLVATGTLASQLTGFLTTRNTTTPLLRWVALSPTVWGVQINRITANDGVLATTTSYNLRPIASTQLGYTQGALIYAYVRPAENDIMLTLNGNPPLGATLFVVGVFGRDDNNRRFIFINGYGTHWNPEDQASATWDSVTQKPFEDIGAGLDVVDGTLVSAIKEPITTVYLDTTSTDKLKEAMPNTYDACHVVIAPDVAQFLIGRDSRLYGTVTRGVNSSYTFFVTQRINLGWEINNPSVTILINCTNSYTTLSDPVSYINDPLVIQTNSTVNLADLKNGSGTTSDYFRNLDYVILDLVGNNKSYYLDGLINSEGINDQFLKLHLSPNTDASRWDFMLQTYTKGFYFGKCDPQTNNVTDLKHLDSSDNLEVLWDSVTQKPFTDIGTGLSVVNGTLTATGGGSWSSITDKPFETLGEAFGDDDGALTISQLYLRPYWNNIEFKEFETIGAGLAVTGDGALTVDTDEFPTMAQYKALLARVEALEGGN